MAFDGEDYNMNPQDVMNPARSDYKYNGVVVYKPVGAKSEMISGQTKIERANIGV